MEGGGGNDLTSQPKEGHTTPHGCHLRRWGCWFKGALPFTWYKYMVVSSGRNEFCLEDSKLPTHSRANSSSSISFTLMGSEALDARLPCHSCHLCPFQSVSDNWSILSPQQTPPKLQAAYTALEIQGEMMNWLSWHIVRMQALLVIVGVSYWKRFTVGLEVT